MYPDPEMKGLDWDGVRDELLPKVQAAEDISQVRLVISDMVSRLGESHFALIPKTAYGTLATRAATPESVPAPAPEATLEADPEVPAEPDPAAVAEASPEPEPEPGPERAPAKAADPDAPTGAVGLTVRCIEGTIVVVSVDDGSPAATAGVLPGWIITKVGEAETDAITKPLLEAMPRSGALYAAAAVHRQLAAPVASEVTLELLNGSDEPVELVLESGPVRGEAVRLGMLPEAIVRLDHELLDEDRVAYVSFTIWLPAVVGAFGDAMADAKARGVDGVIIDLRGNPGGVAGMVMGMGGYFIAERGVALATMTTRDNTLRLVVNPRATAQRLDGVPLAILIDGHSVSTSEIFASGLQKVGRARVFGETSAGMALPSIIEELANGDALQFVTADLLDPDGERVEGIGAVPDVPAPMTREALLAGHDPALDAALGWIDQTRTQGDPE